MRRPPAYDQGSYQSEIWKSRLRRFVRAGGRLLDYLHGFLLILFTVLVGAIAGVLAASRWGGSPAPLAGAIAGGLGGAMLGFYWARRVFFRESATPAPAPPEPTPGAQRWPGVEEQFRKIRARIPWLAALLMAPFLMICYVSAAGRFGWPVPVSIPRPALLWGLVGGEILALLLMAWTLRCPMCRGFLWRAAEIYECPHCGITLRD